MQRVRVLYVVALPNRPAAAGAAWRRDRYGAVGTGDKEFVHFDPMVVTALAAHKIVGVATGAFHSLAVTDMGLVFAWGDNSHGQARLPAVRSFAACASACGVCADGVADADGPTVVQQRTMVCLCFCAGVSTASNRTGEAQRAHGNAFCSRPATVRRSHLLVVLLWATFACRYLCLRSLLRLSFACLGWDRRSRAGGAAADTCLHAGEPYGPAGHTQCP